MRVGKGIIRIEPSPSANRTPRSSLIPPAKISFPRTGGRTPSRGLKQDRGGPAYLDPALPRVTFVLQSTFVSFGFAIMGYAKSFALFVLCSVTCGCSANVSTGSIGDSGLRFEHRTETLSGYKTALTVIAATDARTTEPIWTGRRRPTRSVAKQACPKGYEFYTDAPITSRRNERNERTFVFGCR